MLKYLILLFLIPLIVVGLSMTVILYYNPAITQSIVYGASGPITYSASTIAPDGRAVFVFIIDNLNSFVKNYQSMSSGTYKYFLVIENKVSISLFSPFDKIRIIVFGSNTPIPSYDGSVSWSVASKIMSFIENNKYAEIPLGSKVEINLDNIRTAYIYSALIVYVKKDTNLGRLSLTYSSQQYFNMLVTDAIEEEMRGNYSVSTVLSDYRRGIVNDIFGLNNGVVISIVSKISLSRAVYIRWIIGFLVLLTLLVFDYRRNPENYELLKKVLRRFSRTRK